MKKKLLTGALIMVLILLLAACGCDHEWQAATCTTAKTCQLCGEVEGEALGHTWQEAACETPKTCSTCKITEGEPLDHDWQDATTDAPKTCSLCKLTEGERIITDPRFTTQSTQFLHGTWTCEINLTAEMMGLVGGFHNGIDYILSMEFSNAGDLVGKMALKDEAAFMKDYRAFILDNTYASLAQQGISKEDADEAMLQLYGLKVEEYVDAVLKSLDMATMFQVFNFTEVYYVADGKIYAALSWNSQLFEPSAYALKDGILTIDGMTLEEGGEPLQWKKAE